MRRTSARLRLAVFAIVVAWPLAGAVAESQPESWHYDVWNHLMSPYCPGRTLLDCTSSQAAELRGWIAEQEKAGRSRDEVETQLYQEFGDVILQAPKASGFGLAAYVIPVVAFLAGAALVMLFFKRQAAAATPPLAPVAALPDADLERRIDEEMRRG